MIRSSGEEPAPHSTVPGADLCGKRGRTIFGETIVQHDKPRSISSPPAAPYRDIRRHEALDRKKRKLWKY